MHIMCFTGSLFAEWYHHLTLYDVTMPYFMQFIELQLVPSTRYIMQYMRHE